MESKFAVISDRIKSLLSTGDTAKWPQGPGTAAKKTTQSQEEVQKTVKAGRPVFTAPRIFAAVLFIALLAMAVFALPKIFTSEEASATDKNGSNGVNGEETENALYTPEDFGYNPSTVVDVGDEVLEKAIVQTLNGMGEIVGDSITVDDMFKLETLAVSRLAERYIDISFIQQDTNDDVEVIYTQDDIESLEALQYAPNLKKLILIGYNGFGVSGLTPIWQLSELEFLYLYDDLISDIIGIEDLGKLSVLVLCDNQISDIGPIQGLTMLSYLDLQRNNITDIGDLGALSHLCELWLGGNEISDISGLKDLSSLKNLHLYNNPISDISAIGELYRLQSLNLDGIDIADLSPLYGLDKLEWLSLDGDEENDIDQIAK